MGSLGWDIKGPAVRGGIKFTLKIKNRLGNFS